VRQPGPGPGPSDVGKPVKLILPEGGA